MVKLIEFNENHLEATYDWMQDENLRKSFFLDKEITRSDHLKWFKKASEDPSQMIFAICFGELHVGNVGLKNIDLPNKKAESWIYVGLKNNRGKRLGTNALNQLTDIARPHIGKIYCHISINNIASIKSFINAGYKVEGILEQDIFYKGEPVNVFRLARFLQ